MWLALFLCSSCSECWKIIMLVHFSFPKYSWEQRIKTLLRCFNGNFYGWFWRLHHQKQAVFYLLNKLHRKPSLNGMFAVFRLIADELRAYFDCYVDSRPDEVWNFWKPFAIDHVRGGSVHWWNPFLKSCARVGHHKIRALFRFLRLVFKELFHNLLNHLLVYIAVFFSPFFATRCECSQSCLRWFCIFWKCWLFVLPWPCLCLLWPSY